MFRKYNFYSLFYVKVIDFGTKIQYDEDVPVMEQKGGAVKMYKTNPLGYTKLKAYFIEKGLRQKEVAKELGIGRATLNCKINRKKADFTLNEVRKLRDTFGVDPSIFFN